jgi:hypothetical protein
MTMPQDPDPLAGLATAAQAPPLPPLPALLLQLLLALALAVPVAVVYARTHRGTSYSRTFVQSLVLLPLVVTIVMIAIGDSMARAFGLFGALALIRFRTPIKDSRDTIFLFLAVGITVGVANTLLAVAGTAFVLLVAIALTALGFGRRALHDGVLQFTVTAPTSGLDDQVRAVLTQHCRRFDLVSLRDAREGGALDYAYQLRLHGARHHEALVAALRAVPGARDVSLLVDDGRAEA